MKKKIAALALVLSIATVGTAFAWGGGHGMRYQQPQMQRPMYQQVDKVTQDKLDAFYSDTQDLRKQIVTQQATRMALMQSTNPDPAAVSKNTGELFDLQTVMQEKAVAAGVDSYMGGAGMGVGRGMMGGRGGGRGMMAGCRYY